MRWQDDGDLYQAQIELSAFFPSGECAAIIVTAATATPAETDSAAAPQPAVPPPYRQKKWQYSMGLGGAVKAMPKVSGS